MECEVCGNSIKSGDLHCDSCFSLVQNEFLDEEMIVADDLL
ncbi:MAG: hypothetical protein QF596_03120 [Acidimicrobiales bacterium]|jgi:hypothetical protein|nr:hypothetical protein [Acidimicrobiales bacterium]MDP6298690.1 hypothetical protein [Acidimicrobiales bacterium]HJM27827.1 hypothetical protein [Acidimicrobiales bacterium]HJM97237.1 hypothetical protein [Acidimicrobiales bacterium]